MTSCEPGHFCPDHADAVAAYEIAGLAFLALALVLLIALAVRAVLALVHRLTGPARTPEDTRAAEQSTAAADTTSGGCSPRIRLDRSTVSLD